MDRRHASAVSLTRRTALGAGVLLVALPAQAGVADAAPPAADVAAWVAYEARLRDRLSDAAGGRFDDPAAQAALNLINRARARSGAEPLVWHAPMATAARAHAADLAARNYVEHLSPEGFDPSHRFWLLDRSTIGSPAENIAYHRGEDAPRTAAQMIEQWRRSPTHWANLNRATHTHAALALLRRPGRAWLVGLFAHPLATLPEPLAFQVRGPDVARALRSLPADLRPRLAIPQGVRLGKVDGPPPVMQITAVRRAGLGAVDEIGGPIFLVGSDQSLVG